MKSDSFQKLNTGRRNRHCADDGQWRRFIARAEGLLLQNLIPSQRERGSNLFEFKRYFCEPSPSNCARLTYQSLRCPSYSDGRLYLGAMIITDFTTHFIIDIDTHNRSSMARTFSPDGRKRSELLETDRSMMVHSCVHEI